MYGDTVSMYRLEELVIHQDFKPRYPLRNDLALVKVNSRIRYNNFIQAICIAHQDKTTDDFKICVSLGFGQTSRGWIWDSVFICLKYIFFTRFNSNAELL